MSYLALYRKYRPIDFSTVYGQEEIVTVIRNAIVNNKISHAYLFSGPRGTGKTTIAKIIARLVNCDNLVDSKPCGKCYNCLHFNNSNDVVEIDAASNNGVDEIRELRDKINLVPSYAKYKVYIIDEVHMLTNQAFNALLKTLEEPPSHVIFILATTEPSKIPLTISSRCQKFRFSKISDDRIVDRLKEIAGFENINIEEDALYEIARISDGGMRDSINMLDQLVSYCNSEITLDDVYAVNGSVSYDDLFVLLSSVISNNKVEIINFIDKIDSDGKDINKFIQELLIFLKDVILYMNTGELSNVNVKNDYVIKVSKIYDDKLLYNLIEELNNVQTSIRLSTHSSIIFMTFMLKIADSMNAKKVDVDNLSSVNVSNAIIKDGENISREIKTLGNNLKISDEVLCVRINNALATASKSLLNDIKGRWKLVDDYIFDDNFSVAAGLLKDSMPVVVAENYIIVANSLVSVVDRINELSSDIEVFLKKVFDFDFSVVAITYDKWNVEKMRYIDNIKKGVKYSIKEVSDNSVNREEINKSPVDELVDLVGDGVIEYK